MAATDRERKPVHGPEVEMVEKVGDNTPRDGDAIPTSTRESFSEQGMRLSV